MFSTLRAGATKEFLLSTLLAVPVGIVAAYGALAFIFLISLVQLLFFGFGHEGLPETVPLLPDWRIVLAPTVGGLVVGLITWKLIQGQRSYGPTDVMQAVHEADGKLSLRVGVGSAVASTISIGAGASVGRYGPAVHLGATLGSWIAQKLRLSRAQRLALLGSGVAAAIAASFNAPLAGVLFASEVMLGGRALRSFVPITIASVVGTAVARAHLGEFSIFAIADSRIEHVYEYPLFALTGVLGGLLAVLFMRTTLWMSDFANSIAAPIWAKPMFAGAVLGVIALQFPHVLGLGFQVIRDTLGGLLPLGLLCVLVAAKLLATALSLGFGFSGGVFGPALFLGATLGGALGNVVVMLFPGMVSSASVYAVAAMGAVISCVIGAPVTTILIAFELTGSYSLTTAVMLAVVCAGITTRLVFPFSYFRYQLRSRGVDPDEGREVQILRAAPISEALSEHYVAIGPQCTIAQAEDRHLADREADLMVVDEEGRLLGVVTLFQLVEARRAGLSDSPVAQLLEMPQLLITGSMNLYDTMQALSNFIGISVPVVDNRDDMRLLGVVHENTVINAYNLAVEEARFEERGS